MNKMEATERKADAAPSKTASVHITAALEFVVVAGVCAAVRDRGTGDLLDDHHALHERITLARHGTGQRLLIHAMGMIIQGGAVQRSRRLSAAERSHIRSIGWPLVARGRWAA